MNIYLIKTDSRVLFLEELKKIIPKEEKYIGYVYNKNIEDILEEATYVSLFDEKKYVVVKNADFFGKDKLAEKEEKLLDKYLDNPYEKTILIFMTYEDIDKRKSITKKLISKYTYLELNSLKGYELIKNISKKLSIYKIEEASIKYLVEASLNNYDLIMSEIEKLSLIFQKNDTISLKQIKEIVASNINENLFKFTDAVISRNANLTFKILKDFLSVKIDVLQLINLLIREFRLMIYYKIYANKNFNVKEIAKKLNLQDWQMNKVVKNAANYHLDDLKDYLLNLAKMDFEIKSGHNDKNLAFYNFLMMYFA